MLALDSRAHGEIHPPPQKDADVQREQREVDEDAGERLPARGQQVVERLDVDVAAEIERVGAADDVEGPDEEGHGLGRPQRRRIEDIPRDHFEDDHGDGRHEQKADHLAGPLAKRIDGREQPVPL